MFGIGGKMSKNNYWVLMLKGDEENGDAQIGENVQIFTSWPECEMKMRNVSRAVYHGFPTKDEAEEFIAGKWRGNPISKKAATWLEGYKAMPGQLKPDTALSVSGFSVGEYPKYCAYVDGSYDPRSKMYGFGVVLICDGKIDKFYGGGKDKDLAELGCGAGELLACMEAVKHAEGLGWPEITIIYDSEIIAWAYRGCGDELTQAAGQYMYEMREKMKIEVMSIEGRSHEAGGNSAKALADKRANELADKLARKGAGIVD